MRNVTEENITDTFLSYFGPDTDPRLREILGSLSRHLHDFARETRLTHAEWNAGLDIGDTNCTPEISWHRLRIIWHLRKKVYAHRNT